MSNQFINDLKINISLATKPVSQAGFGTPLILGEKSAGVLLGTYNEFADLASMLTAGFTSSDPEYKMASAIFAQSPTVPKIAIYVRDTDDLIADVVALVADRDWYVLLIPERDKASLHSAGDAASSIDKIFFGCTSDITALDSRNNIREAYLIHSSPETYPECALVGMCLPKTPGSYTWKWKAPNGVTASNFTLTQLNTIREKHGFTMSERAGIVYSDEGITTGGEYIDIIQIRDYIKSTLGTDIFSLQVNCDKIPYTNQGITQIESVIRTRLRICGSMGMIATVDTDADKKNSDEGIYQYTVTIPERSDIAAIDRAARKIPGVAFKLIASGAVHELTIDGVITV